MQPPDRIAERIVTLRGLRVILDSDLAALYGVQTRRLNEQVRRNLGRFPPEFMFQLTNHELMRLMSQFATSKTGRGGVRKPPLAFTEFGALMAATVLNSPEAIEVSVHVVRAFVRMREALESHTEIARQLANLERKVGTHDRAILEILQAIRQLTQPPEAPRRKRIGFV
ncbi:MAG: ORF6N domain-containing protein [Betaproteobacteria bacterium]